MDKQSFLGMIKEYACAIAGNLKKKNKDEKRRVSPLIVCIIAAAALLLLFMKPSEIINTDKTAENTETSENIGEQLEYVKMLEGDLKNILEKISGAGNVSVSIYIDSSGEKILAEDEKKESEVSESNGSKKETQSGEYQIITSSGSSLGGSSAPYVVQEKLPYPIGVLVVAEGASDITVRNEIYEAVKALYGLSANRIKVTY